MAEQIAPTRSNLLQRRDQLNLANRGADLLKRKRDALIGERLSEPLEDWADLAQQRSQRTLAQLEHVAEEHHPLGAVERGEQPIERLGVAHEVVPARGAEVEIGQDRGPHRVDGGSSV